MNLSFLTKVSTVMPNLHSSFDDFLKLASEDGWDLELGFYHDEESKLSLQNKRDLDMQLRLLAQKNYDDLIAAGVAELYNAVISMMMVYRLPSDDFPEGGVTVVYRIIKNEIIEFEYNRGEIIVDLIPQKDLSVFAGSSEVKELLKLAVDHDGAHDPLIIIPSSMVAKYLADTDDVKRFYNEVILEIMN